MKMQREEDEEQPSQQQYDDSDNETDAAYSVLSSNQAKDRVGGGKHNAVQDNANVLQKKMRSQVGEVRMQHRAHHRAMTDHSAHQAALYQQAQQRPVAKIVSQVALKSSGTNLETEGLRGSISIHGSPVFGFCGPQALDQMPERTPLFPHLIDHTILAGGSVCLAILTSHDRTNFTKIAGHLRDDKGHARPNLSW
jgi:hypothetical protein